MEHDTQIPRRHETPNAVMHTYASRSLTGTDLAVWSAEMAPGASGPVHAADADQVLVVLEGELELTLRGTSRSLIRGSSVVLPAGEERRLTNRSAAPVVALVSSTSGVRASTAEQEGVPVPWAA